MTLDCTEGNLHQVMELQGPHWLHTTTTWIRPSTTS